MKASTQYKILFEPIQIGPVTAKNRFYQVPHCTGMGWLRPRMVNQLRATKAEGGWGVVCTEYCSIHPSSDDLPFPYHSLWDETDIKSHGMMTEMVHRHETLAGVELWAGGARSSNLFSREVPISATEMPSHSILSSFGGTPRQARVMDKSDIKVLRERHRKAAIRAMEADFDIVYVYATHEYLLSQFLCSKTNDRSDEYGGSLENRIRLVRELIEETKEAIGHRCAVAARFSVDDGGGADGEPVYNELREMFEMLAELPDLWDININDYSLEMGVSRYVKEGALEPYMGFVKSVTTKPVVTVGRFTSPETMVSQIKRGIADFIGAARPSISDPFLPNKIAEDRAEDIRECIGCNICYASDGLGVPLRCTQNPTMGEEWRRGWHPEKINKKSSDSQILVVGAGPAGLEVSRALGERGYKVMLAEAERELGGRVSRECKLPGLSEWARVRDYRIGQIAKLPNVEVFRESRMTVEDILNTEVNSVVVSTGSTWKRDGSGRYQLRGIKELGPKDQVYTPDDIMSGALPRGNILVYDDDSYYMASAIAELLGNAGNQVTYVTPDLAVSEWSKFTDEQFRVHRSLVNLGVKITTAHGLKRFDGNNVTLGDIYTGDEMLISAEFIVLVTSRTPQNNLFYDLTKRTTTDNPTGGPDVSKIGDCDAPSIIADAVFAGHRWAREYETVTDDARPFRVDRVFAEYQ